MVATDYEIGAGKTYADHSSALGVIRAAYGDSLYNDGRQRLLTYPSSIPSTKGSGTEYNENFIDSNFKGYASGYLELKAMVPHFGQRGEGIIIKGIGNPIGTTYSINLDTYAKLTGYAFDMLTGSFGYNLAVRLIHGNYSTLYNKLIVYDIILPNQQLYTIQDGRYGAGGIHGVYNSAIFNCSGNGIASRFYGFRIQQGFIVNCSILNCTIPLGVESYGFQQIFAAPQFKPQARNCIAQNISGGSPNLNFASFTNYINNISDDATGGGLINQTAKQIAFNKYITGIEDLRIKEKSVAKDYGINYYITPELQEDVAGITRHATNPWDAGAFTYVELPTTEQKISVSSQRSFNMLANANIIPRSRIFK